VRAAAPQRRHQSCSSASGAPHIGQLSLEATGAAAPARVDSADPPPDTGTPPSAGATLTSLQVAGSRESCLERTPSLIRLLNSARRAGDDSARGRAAGLSLTEDDVGVQLSLGFGVDRASSDCVHSPPIKAR
jgi:hypothetical protein